MNPAPSFLLALTVVGLLAGCSGEQTTSLTAQATPEAEGFRPAQWLEPLDYEQALLEDYFEDRQAAFDQGTQAGVAFLVEHNMAGLRATVDGCTNRWFGNHPDEHVRELITPKWSTLRRDPAWAMPMGPRVGEPLGDDIFVIEVRQELIGDQYLSASHQSLMHFQIHGSGVRNLVLCEQVHTVNVPKPVESPSLEAIPTVPAMPYPSFGAYPPGYLPPISPQIPTIPVPSTRPGAPIVLPPIQSTGRPVVRPSQSPKPSPSLPHPSQQPVPSHIPQPTPKPSTSPTGTTPTQPPGTTSPPPEQPTTAPTKAPTTEKPDSQSSQTQQGETQTGQTSQTPSTNS